MPSRRRDNVDNGAVDKKQRRGSKAARTRAKILAAALAQFREHGYDGATMRDIAKAADMSLGAAYYHFASKDALVLAYYRDSVSRRREMVQARFAETDDLGERLRALFHLHHEAVRGDRRLLGALVRSVADPESEVSVFSAATREVRNASIAICDEALAVDVVPEHVRDLGALGLWGLDLAFMLYFVWDDSPDQARTAKLVDDTVEMILPLIPLLSSPLAGPLLSHVARTLLDAGLVPD